MVNSIIDKHKDVIVNVFLFIFIAVFFTQISPLFLSDGDDWYFSGSIRLPWPMWGVFNPSKVFPEILEPLGGYIAAFMVYPLTGDYVASIAHTQSIIISAFIFVFFWISYKYFNVSFS